MNKNHLELVYILAQPRNFQVFRKFLADIYCIENLDFFVTVQYYRILCENELEEIEFAIESKRTQLSAMAPLSNGEEEDMNASGNDTINEDEDYNDNDNDNDNKLNSKNLKMQGNNNVVWDESAESSNPTTPCMKLNPVSSASTNNNNNNNDAGNTQKYRKGGSPGLEVIVAGDSPMASNDSPQANATDTPVVSTNVPKIENYESNSMKQSQRGGGAGSSPRERGRSRGYSSGPDKSSPRMFKTKGFAFKKGNSIVRLQRQNSTPSKNMTTLGQAARPYIETDANTGQESLQIKKIPVNYPLTEMQLKKQGDWKKQASWIYMNYIPANSANCLNLSSKMRKEYIKKFTELKLADPNQTSRQNLLMQNIAISDVSRNLNQQFSIQKRNKNYYAKKLDELEELEKQLIEAKSLFDMAQAESWKLMAQDSMSHFRTSQFFEDVFKFVDKRANGSEMV